MSETLFLEKIFFILLKHIKNRYGFSIVKNPFYFTIKTYLIFLLSKNIFLVLQKPLFSTYTKQIWYFDKSKSFFFLLIKENLIFLNKRRDFIHK